MSEYVIVCSDWVSKATHLEISFGTMFTDVISVFRISLERDLGGTTCAFLDDREETCQQNKCEETAYTPRAYNVEPEDLNTIILFS